MMKISGKILSLFSRRRLGEVATAPYVYRPDPGSAGFAESVAALQNKGYRVVSSAVDNISAAVVQQVLEQMRALGIEVIPYHIDPDDYKAYVRDAGYLTKYPEYYADNRAEKSLEHYITLKLLNMGENDVFIDIASEHSPIPEIYARLTGAVCYSQDIMYPKGIRGNRIGGDACSMPVPGGFATKAALTCSLEHFEGDADGRLFQELARVLKPSGVVLVVPLYLFTEPVTQTDPTVSVPAAVTFDEGAAIYCAEGWGNRHGRFYSSASFVRRIVKPLKGKLAFKVYHLVNAGEIDPSIYARFTLIATRL